jgi:hypothetical protein
LPQLGESRRDRHQLPKHIHVQAVRFFPRFDGHRDRRSPRTVGAFYDVAYDRSLDAPAETTGNGVASGPCTAGAAPTGTTTEYEEGIDKDKTLLNGGNPGASLIDGGIPSLEPKRMPRDPKHNCAPVYPWNFVRQNTIFGVIHGAGGYTAWSDKHPSYISVSGPGNGRNVDDYYSPEINSSVVALPGITTLTGMSCSPVPDSSQLASWTDSFKNIQCYDTLKVNAVLNWIDGKTHLGNAKVTVPALFGMNFQVVSVGQKLIEKGVGTGGYLDYQGTPSELLVGEIKFVDAAIGEMVARLKKDNLYDSTAIIITAKHGQSPIDPHLFFPIPGHNGTNGKTPADILASYLPYSESPNNPTGIGPTADDVALIWLSHPRDTAKAVALLEENAKEIGLGQIFANRSLEQMFNAAGLPPKGDPRSPDIIVTPNVGVNYTGSTKKQSEHGGFSHDDTNVMLLVSHPSLSPNNLTDSVTTMQVAPTVLKVLGLNPNSLSAVRSEGTQVLPGISLGNTTP